MKRFWVGLLSLGLVVAFSMPAFAAPADFWGHLRWRGWHNANPSLKDSSATNAGSSSFIEQRLRLGSTIKLLEGVELRTRFDATENFWQGARTAAVNTSTSEQQNIQWEIANMTFKAPIGTFLVGYTNAPLGYGTKYWESGEGIRPVIRWTVPMGPIEYRATFEKKGESQSWGSPALATSDADSDIYALAGRWKGPGALEVGMQWQYLVANGARPGVSTATTGYSTKLHALQPYVKAKFGPLDVEAEGLWVTGDAKKYDNTPAVGSPDVKAEGKGAYVNARFNMGPAYIGGTVSYTAGDDHATLDKMEGSFASSFDGASSDGGSTSPKPTLMMTNTTFNNYFGNTGAVLAAADRTNPNVLSSSNQFAANNDNLMQFTVYGNYSVTPKLDIFGLFTMAKVDKKPYNSTTGVQFISDDFGKEANLAAFYKITSQLTYNVQAAYFWTGDYFKGTNAASKVDNTYVLMHALLLEF